MTGGTLTGVGAGDANGVYSFNSTNGFVATSDSTGNPAVVNAASMALQNGNLTINVTRGTANPPADMVISSVIREYGGDTNGINVPGSGILQLTAANTYNGPTTVNGGTLQLGNGQSGQDGSIADTSGVTNNSTMICNLFGNSSATYAISGSGSLTKLGQGQLTLAGSNSYTGTTTVGGGGLSINGGDSSAAMVVSGGSLYVNIHSPAATVSVAGGATLGGNGSLLSARRQCRRWRQSRFQPEQQRQHLQPGQPFLRGQQHA